MNKEKELQEEINEYVEAFNSLCEQIGAHLLTQLSNSKDIRIYNEVVCDLIKKKPNEPISVFIMNIYANDKYRMSILNSDEDFFMKHDHDELAGDDPEGAGIISQVKNNWSKLNKNSRSYIKEAFITIIELCKIYIERKDDLNGLKKKNKFKHA